jgi:AraC family L-rhamnose operon regulatory protein RhaS
MFTSGKAYFKDVRFPVCYQKDDAYRSIPYRNERLVVSFLRTGRCVLDGNGRKYIVTAPGVLLLSERTSVTLEERHEFCADTVYFHPSFINFKLDFTNIREPDPVLNYTEQQDLYLFAPFDLSRDTPTVIPLHAQSITECDLLFKKLDRAIHYSGDDYCPCWIRAVLISILVFLLDLEKSPGGAFENEIPVTDPSLKDIVLFLNTHYWEHLTVDGIAGRFSTNRTTLNERFNRVTGSSVMRFLRNIRINAAARELRTTDKTVTEIGLETGFRDISNFCKLFRVSFGCTPGAYRNMYGQSWEAAGRNPSSPLGTERSDA